MKNVVKVSLEAPSRYMGRGGTSKARGMSHATSRLRCLGSATEGGFETVNLPVLGSYAIVYDGGMAVVRRPVHWMEARCNAVS